jgi:hypothetical protein
LVGGYAVSTPSLETSGCTTGTAAAASAWRNGRMRVTSWSPVDSGTAPSRPSLTGTILTNLPLGTVVKPFTCNTDWKTR